MIVFGLGICLPLGLREAALLVPALPLPLHEKLIAQAYDAKHTDHLLPPTTPPTLSPSFSLSWSSLSCCCHHHHHRPAALPVSGYCSHPTRSFPPVAIHQPPTHHAHPPPLRGAPPYLYLLPWATDKQADGRTDTSRTVTKPATQEARKQ